MTNEEVDYLLRDLALHEMLGNAEAPKLAKRAIEAIEELRLGLSQKAEGEAGNRDALVRLVGSYPLHTDDRGDENSVLHDAFAGSYEDRTHAVSCLVDDILTEMSLYAAPLPRSPQGVDALCNSLQSLRSADNPASWTDWDRGVDHGLVTALQVVRALPREQDEAGAVAWISPAALDLLKTGSKGAFNKQISNVEFSKFTVPLYDAPKATSEQVAEGMWSALADALKEDEAHPLATDGFSAGQEAMREAAAKRARACHLSWYCEPHELTEYGKENRRVCENIEAAIRDLPITKPDSTEGRDA